MAGADVLQRMFAIPTDRLIAAFQSCTLAKAEWTHQARAHFVERRLSALDLLAEHAADRGDLASVLEYGTEILEIDGLRERAHRQLMRAHLALGQRACALRQYQLCVELLERELGVEPSHLTRQLHDSIRADAELPPEIRLLD